MKKKRFKTFITIICFVGPLSITTLACFLAYSDLTSAWFNTDVTYKNHFLIAASFDISSIVDNGYKTLEIIDGKYTLDEGSYNIRLNRIGKSTSAGYAVITIGDEIYHTIPIEKGKPISFKIITDTKVDLTITPKWGIDTDEENPLIEEGQVVEIDLVEDILEDETLEVVQESDDEDEILQDEEDITAKEETLGETEKDDYEE